MATSPEMLCSFCSATLRLAQHVERGNADGLLISSRASLWALLMDAATGFSSIRFFGHSAFENTQTPPETIVMCVFPLSVDTSIVIVFPGDLNSRWKLNGSGLYICAALYIGFPLSLHQNTPGDLPEDPILRRRLTFISSILDWEAAVEEIDVACH